MEQGYLSWVVELIKTGLEAGLNWFSLIMEKTGMLPMYFAGALVALSVGFLLSRFGSTLSGASDVAAGMFDFRGKDSRYRRSFSRSFSNNTRSLPGPKALPSGSSDRFGGRRISRK